MSTRFAPDATYYHAFYYAAPDGKYHRKGKDIVFGGTHLEVMSEQLQDQIKAEPVDLPIVLVAWRRKTK